VSLLQAASIDVRAGAKVLIEDMSLVLAPGEFLAVIGPNGAGKSTLLSAVLGQIPFEGRIAMNWADAGTIGYVPQTFAVDPTLPVTVADFLALTRQRRPVCLGITRSARATMARLLARVGLSGIETCRRIKAAPAVRDTPRAVTTQNRAAIRIREFRAPSTMKLPSIESGLRRVYFPLDLRTKVQSTRSTISPAFSLHGAAAQQGE